MQFDSKKLFGYPVLQNSVSGEDKQSMDYPKGEFQQSIQLKIDPKSKHKIVVEYEIAMSVPELNNLVDEGKAIFKLNISCPKTFWSNCFDIKLEGEIKLDGRVLKDQVELSIVLVSQEGINLKSEKFHPDFEGETFSVPKHSILAWHAPVSYTIEKEQFRPLRSLIDIIRDPETENGHIGFDGSENYVKVSVNDKMHDAIAIASTSRSLSKSVVLASFYQSVCCQMLLEMILMDKDNEDIQSRRWSSVIEQKCGEKNINWTNQNELATNAQRLLGECMKDIADMRFGAGS